MPHRGVHAFLLKFSSHLIPSSLYLLKCAAQRAFAGLSRIVSFFWKSSYAAQINQKGETELVPAAGEEESVHTQTKSFHPNTVFPPTLAFLWLSSCQIVSEPAASFHFKVFFQFHPWSKSQMLGYSFPFPSTPCFFSCCMFHLFRSNGSSGRGRAPL